MADYPGITAWWGNRTVAMPDDFWPEQLEIVGKHKSFEVGFKALSRGEFDQRLKELKFALWQAAEMEKVQ